MVLIYMYYSLHLITVFIRINLFNAISKNETQPHNLHGNCKAPPITTFQESMTGLTAMH